MSIYPDFQAQGYQVIKELGRNREGGRITWLATNINTGQQEVIKQFCFAQAGSSWSASEAHEREIQVLKGLKHPSIPSYLNSFATSDGFCLVQQYINASTLAEHRSFSPEEIKQIAVKVLEILVYLQNRIPSVIHRDIKPENILVDEHINVYLIDFGFARIGSQEVAGSSVFKGTPGFIPPEQMFKPTDATDLYALGATLICLLTGIKSTKIDQLQDEDDPYVINFRHLLPRLSLRFLDWLEKMVKRQQKQRFSNAEAALEALKPLDVIRIPIVTLSQNLLEFKAQNLGEKINQLITIKNSVPDTLLEGRWEVAPHPSDPPHTPDYHAWISVQPAKFKRNNIDFRIQIDTNNLMAQKDYKRQLILYSNSYPESHILTVKLQTADLPIENVGLSYWGLIRLFSIGVFTSIVMIWIIGFFISNPSSFLIWLFVVIVLISVLTGGVMTMSFISLVSLFVLALVSVATSQKSAVVEKKDSAEDPFTIMQVRLILGFGASVGAGIIIGFLNPFVLLALTGTGLPALSMLLYSPLKRRKLIAKYRQSEESLIKP